MNTSNGIFIVDKPSGWTSHDVVKKARNLFGVSKVGHTGTLDPIATGVLILLIGKATKSAMLFENDKKRYLAEITFGWATDTYDRTGTKTAMGDPADVNMNKLKDAIKSFIGESEQIPPMFSAVKVNGKKLYQLARKGITVKRKPRKICITKIKPDLSDFPRIKLDIECSKGTYIRTIAHKLGEMACCPAHLSALQRTASGKYTIEEAVEFLTLIEAEDKSNLERFIYPVPDQEIMV
ncbi:tRNA pseudouridine(55) synthase TruB [Candidatus Latescibacterota bacterium]